MSDFGDVPAAILSAIDGAITLGGSRDGFIGYEHIPAGAYPYAMTYGPVKEIDRGEFQHGVETTATNVVVVWNGDTLATVNAAMVLIEAALNGSTLGSIVEDTWVAVAGRDESLESPLIAAVFQINTRVNV